MIFSVHRETRKGGRRDNQDRVGYAYTQKAVLLVACDGMGGHLYGEIAAQYVMEYLAKAFRSCACPAIRDPKLFLAGALQGAHESVTAYAKIANLKEVPRTTCVTCIIQNGKVWGANVGDSRFYHLRDGSPLFRSKDQSYVQMLVEKGKITEDEALVHPERHKIYSCIGQEAKPKIQAFGPFKAAEDDTLLLATDGFWGPLPDSLIGSMFLGSQVSIAVPMLSNVSEAITGGASDNISAVALRIHSWSDQLSEVASPLRDSALVEDVHLEAALESLRLSIK